MSPLMSNRGGLSPLTIHTPAFGRILVMLVAGLAFRYERSNNPVKVQATEREMKRNMTYPQELQTLTTSKYKRLGSSKQVHLTRLIEF
jgi:hypothetical protein